MQNERGLGRGGDGGPVRRSAKRDGGFTLVEVLVSTLVLTIGMVGIAGLLAVTTQAQMGARESARSVRLAQEKIDELLKVPFTSAAVAVGGSLEEDNANHFEEAGDGITIRWAVTNGPMLNDDTRYITVRVVNAGGRQYRNTELSTLIRE